MGHVGYLCTLVGGYISVVCMYVYSNVKVVAFGKAVLGMVEALESLLGQHIIAGVASVPEGVMGRVQQMDTPSSVSKISNKVK